MLSNINFHPLLKQSYNNWSELEKAISRIEDNYEKGLVTEQFAKLYFIINKDLYNVDKVYMREEVPAEIIKKLNFEQTDHGVDGVIIRNDNKLVAYQVKFRSGSVHPTYSDLATFWTESEYADQRIIFSNTKTLPVQTKRRKNQSAILSDTLNGLDSLFFKNMAELTINTQLTERTPKTPYEYQQEIIDDVVNGFEAADRGKLIAACGIGKTLVSKWIVETMDSDLTLFVAPSLSLIKQTIEEWFDKTNQTFDFIAVCSDNSVIRNLDPNLDEFDITPAEANFPVTTDPDEILSFLSKTSIHKKVVFSTYQSIDAIANALLEKEDFFFDFAVFDESHRTAGTKGTDMFTYALDDMFIPIKKRLFMTATEKVVTPRIQKFAENAGQKIFSMDNEDNYGLTFSELNFGQAIEQNIIADYKVVISAMEEEELVDMMEDNKYIEVDVEDESTSTSIDNLFKQVILSKVINELGIEKVISYHSTVKEAKEFIEGGNNKLSLNDVFSQTSPQIKDSQLYFDHVNGMQNASTRRDKLDRFEHSEYGVISNAKCLTEGIDVPSIDAVYFADPKNSTIDIIQAIGRALRKRRDEDKTAYIIIPVIIPKNTNSFNGLRTDLFDTLHSVVQALRDQDDSLAEIIDEVNYQAATSVPRSARVTQALQNKLQVISTDKVNIEHFENSIQLRIGEVNRSEENFESRILNTGAKNERQSSIKRVYTSISDYQMAAFRDNLVMPTINIFENIEDIKPNSEIKINNNNVSHTERIGAIEKLPHKKSKLTSIGKMLHQEPEEFDEVFRSQLLRFYIINKVENQIIFPYRALLKISAEVSFLTKFEFVWCLYPLRSTSEIDIEIAIERIKEMRGTYKNLEILNEDNKEKVLTILNEKYGLQLDFKDVWSSRSTPYNQFNYFKKHLWVYDNIFTEDNQSSNIYSLPNSTAKIIELLDTHRDFEQEAMLIQDVTNEQDIKELKKSYIDIERI